MLLFGSETLVLMTEMLQNLEEVNVSFMRQVTVIKAQKMGVETWQK